MQIQTKILATIERIKQKMLMPDITSNKLKTPSYALDFVGMSQVAVEFKIKMANSKEQEITGYANLYVNLEDPKAKGIHMSRLYLTAQTAFKKSTLSPELLSETLKEFVKSQSGLSTKSKIELQFNYPLEKKALKSEFSGLRLYPIVLSATYNAHTNQTEYITQIEIKYSSTCPCSAALSMQLIEDKVKEEFSEKTSFTKEDLLQFLKKSGNIATPHSQQSTATLTLVTENTWIDFEDLVESLEKTIQTPVQTAVKREDEQEFARLNAENLMFCEDASRRFKSLLESNKEIIDYHIKVSHHESLHAHNAEAIATKHSLGTLKSKL